ncbi:uncharacterized protein HaLaN_10984, partial [Haematococcus lacustris]
MDEYRSRALGTLCALPDHLINLLLLRLSIVDVVRLACTSRALRLICCEEPLWQQLCLLQADELVDAGCSYASIKFLANWRQTALHMLASAPKPPPPPPLSSTSLGTANASLSAARSPHISSGTDNVANSSDSHVISGNSSGETVAAWSVFNPQYTPSAHSLQQAAVPPSPTPLASDFLYRRWLRCHIQLAGFVP